MVLVVGAVIVAVAAAPATTSAALLLGSTLSGCSTGPAATAAVGAAAGAGAPAAATAATAAAINPIGLALLGSEDGQSWNCWKQVIHFTGEAPTPTLDTILTHPSVEKVIATDSGWTVINEWDEKFDIFYVLLPDGVLAAHAQRV